MHQPRYSIPSAKILCRVCLTAVYPADPQINIDGSIFHKQCCKCSQCQCQLNLDSFHASGGEREGGTVTLYCSTHYFRFFSESGGSYLGGAEYARKAERDNLADALLEKAKSPLYRAVDGLRVNDLPAGLSYEHFASSFNDALLQAASSSIQHHANGQQLLEGAADIESRRKQLAEAYEQPAASSSSSSSPSSLSSEFVNSAPVTVRRQSYVSGMTASSLPRPGPAAPSQPPLLGFSPDKIEFRSASGAVFAGSFGEGGGAPQLMGGKMCTVRLANGTTYEGEMHLSKFHGIGRLVSTHGHSFEGEWKDGKMHGKGRYTTFDGRVLEGEFANDEFVHAV